MSKAIGIFDSGVGGLTVLAELRLAFPNQSVVYVGDNKHCPYGDKSVEEIFTYSSRIVEYFISLDIHMIILACNTTSATVLERLQQTYPMVQFIGVISSTVDTFIQCNQPSTLVIATKATIQSQAYKKLINQKNKDIVVYSQATPSFVPLIESGKYKEGIRDEIIQYLNPFIDKIDSIILGCTHYPIIASQIKSVFHKDILIISSSTSIIKEIKEIIGKNQDQDKAEIKIYTTGNTKEFIDSSKDFFQYQGITVKRLNLD